MDWKAEIREALRDLVREMITDASVQAVVQSVDKSAGTIVAIGIDDELEYYNVRLKAVAQDQDGGGILAYPVVGSSVALTILDGVDTLTYVSQFSQIESYQLQLDNGVSLELTKGGELHLNGNGFGGVVKVVELVQRMNVAENAINNLNTLMGSHQHTVLPLPAGLIAAPTLAPPLPISLTTRQELENTIVNHG